jgi:parallel beta-helix repeat protein
MRDMRRVGNRYASLRDETIRAFRPYCRECSLSDKRALPSLLVIATLVIASLIAVVSLITITAEAATLYVGGGGPGNYTTIQAAIDAASPGDTIYVFKGTYKEKVTISKTLTLVGEDTANTVIDGDRVSDVMVITADWVNVSGFRIRNSSWNAGDAGIELSGVQHCHLFENNVSDNTGIGIYLVTSSYNTVTDNLLYENWDPDGAGVYLLSSDNNLVAGNVAVGNAKGILLWSSDANTITGNNISTNWDYGTYLRSANDNTISNNSFFDNWGRGVRVVQSNGNVVSNNTFIQNYEGMSLESSSSNVVANNTLLNNWDNGIEISGTGSNRVADNLLHDNWGDGIRTSYASYNLIENNSIEGSYRADIALVSSNHETVLNNTMVGGGVYIDGSAYYGKSLSHWNTHTIPTSNTVNGKPVYYWKDVAGGSIPLDAGQAILANCSGVVVDGINISDVVTSVEAGFSSGITISNITSWDAYYSILSMQSESVDVHDIVISSVAQMGVSLLFTHDSTITNVSVRSSDYAGVYLRNSYRNELSTLNVSDAATTGLYFEYSGDNYILGSFFWFNGGSGANLLVSRNNTISNTSLIGNSYGVSLSNADNNAFKNDTIASNERYGVNSFNSSANRFFHNDFIDNGQQASDNSPNSWDDGYPSGGNFWSDYTGTDAFSGPNQDIPGSDGIGDTPYGIPGGTNEDRYPLMNASMPRPWRPFAPLNLQAVAGLGNVTLTWDPPLTDGGSAITGYRIYRGLTPGSKTILEEMGNVTSFVDSGLTGGYTYYYQVSAKNTAGEGRKSNQVGASPFDFPGPPGNLVATPGDGRVTLYWSAPIYTGGSPITNYSVYRGNISGGETVLVKLGQQETFVDLNVTNRQTYFYQVSAWNIIGEGQKSAEGSATPAMVPSPPRNLTATAGAGTIALNWTLPADDGGSPITTYMLYRGTTPGGESPMWTVGNILSYVDVNVTGDVTYFYQITAINAIGEGTRSNEANATAMGVPSNPLNLTAVGGNGVVTLSWMQPLSDGGSPIIGYTIYRGLTSGGEIYHATAGVIPTFIDTGLTNGVTYYYKVSASNAIGEGARSNEAYATPMTVPGPPTGVVAMSTYFTAMVEWQAPLNTGGSPVTNYSIYRGTSPGGETLLATIGNLLSYTDINVTNGQIYYYVVSAINAAGEGPKSLEVRVTVPDHPSAPLNLLVASGNQEVTLTWDPPTSDGGCLITNYSIYRGFWSGGETLLTTVSVSTTYTDTGLTNGVAYYYRVSAINPVGEGPKSNEAMAVPSTLPSPPTIVSATGIDGEVVLTIFPPTDSGGLPIITYKMYRGTSPGGEVFITDIGTPSKHFDAGLTNGVMYYYRLSAVNANGESDPSEEASAMPRALPSQPLNAHATAGFVQVQLTWQAPAKDGGYPITAYKVYRGVTSGGETLLATLGNVLSYTDLAVTNGQGYFYKVSAMTVVGEGPQSTEVSATPLSPPSTPSPPQNLVALAGNAQVALAWDTPASDGGSPVTGYSLYRGTAAGGEVFIRIVGNMLTYTDTGLTNGQTYYFEITASNVAGESGRSNEANARPAMVPGQPTGLVAVAGTLRATLTWNAPASDGGSSITNYVIYRGATSGSETTLATVGNVLTYVDSDVVGGRAYFYRVSAINSIGEGPLSVEATVTISPSPNLPPTCSITAPPQGAEVSGRAAIQGVAADADGNIIVVEIRMDGGSWMGASGKDAWSYAWNTKLYSNGQHTIEARSYDGKDFSQVASVTVSVNNPAEQGPGGGRSSSDAVGIALSIALLVVAMLLIFLFLKERRSRKPAVEPQESLSEKETPEEVFEEEWQEEEEPPEEFL